MKDNLLIFALAFVLWEWLNLHITRAKEKRRVWEETKEFAKQRLRRKTKSNLKKEQEATIIKTQA